MGPRRGDFQSAAWLLTQGKLEAGTNVTMRKDRILIKDLISYTMKYRTNIQHLSLTASLYVTKTLKKEGRAFRNIDNKKHIFPTVNQPCFFCSISRKVVHHEEEEGRFHGSAKFQFFSYISPPLEVKARCLELNFQGKKIISSVYAQAKIWRDWSGRKVFFYLFLGQHNTAEFSLAFFLASENPKH